MMEVDAEMFTCRQVFRDMINQGTRSRIHLTDLELETEENLGTLFDLMTGGTVKTDPLTEIPKLYLVKRLAQKYECDVILRRISLQSRTDMYEGKCRTLVTFMVGIFMNDIEVCKAALREAGGWWKVGDWPKQMISGPLMNPSALPPDLYAMIKPKTMWAWTSAYRNVFHLTYENEKELEDHHTGLSSEQRQRRDKYSWQFVFAMFSLAGESSHLYSRSNPVTGSD